MGAGDWPGNITLQTPEPIEAFRLVIRRVPQTVIVHADLHLPAARQGTDPAGAYS